jgi:hypothetical protein
MFPAGWRPYEKRKGLESHLFLKYMSSSSRPFTSMPPPAGFEDGELQRRPGSEGGYQNQTGLISSHPEMTIPDENTQQPAIIYGQKPFKKGFLARAS